MKRGQILDPHCILIQNLETKHTGSYLDPNLICIPNFQDGTVLGSNGRSHHGPKMIINFRKSQCYNINSGIRKG